MLGLIFYVAISYIFSLLLLNIFIGVVGNRYNDEHKLSEEKWRKDVNEIISSRIIAARKRKMRRVDSFVPKIFKKENIECSLKTLQR